MTYGLVERPWSTEWRGISPPLFLHDVGERNMTEKILSIFIDESGDFGPFEHHAPFYLVSMVLHDQNVDISANITALEDHLTNLGYPQHAIHTGPLIRRESVYENELMEQRKKLFNALFHFVRKLDLKYMCASVKKRECEDEIQMTAKLSRSIVDMLTRHSDWFNSYDRVIVYYDNGQVELTKIITAVFTVLLPHVEFRKVKPVDYKLFQAADMVCTIELLALKAEAKSFSNSEMEFFHSIRDFRKLYLRYMLDKRI